VNRQIRITPLVFGLAFIVIGLVALTGTDNDIDVDTAWLWVAGFTAVGTAGLVSVIAAIVQRARGDLRGDGEDAARMASSTSDS